MLKQKLPKYYIIEPTNICNFMCPICPNSQYSSDEKGKMSFSLFQKIIDQIYDVAEVIQLYWMGEPLLNDSIYDMIKTCKKKTWSKVMLSTNGSLLSRELIELLVKSGLDEIIVSVDACESQEIYSAIRTGGEIGKLNENINVLLEYSENISIVLQFIDMYINKSEKYSFINKWTNQNCEISISCLYTWANQIPSLNLASDNLSPVAKKQRVPCADLWNKMAIHWDGTVSACCFDWNNKLVIGDCSSELILDIWNNEKINCLRALHENMNFSKCPICMNCDSWAESDEYSTLYNLNCGI